MNKNEYIINVSHLSKKFNKITAVYDFSMTAKSGEIIGFLGPNGSGKTTVIRMLCGLTKPDSGKGECIGYDIMTESDYIRSQVGYMTQHFSLYKYLTIRENLKFVAGIFKIKNSDKRIDEIAEQLNLRTRMNQPAGSLSGGWKQKLALGAALLHHPKLVLLDEPTAGVDPEARQEFWDIIANLSGSNITVLVSTHYMDEAERCQRIIYLAYGHVVTEGTSQEIIKKSNLHTWTVRGENITRLARELEKLNGVDQVVIFGLNLHVSGKDRWTLLESLRPYFLNTNYYWEGMDPTLEDVFIHLVAQAKEKRFD